jgi:hypothetical protein
MIKRESQAEFYPGSQKIHPIAPALVYNKIAGSSAAKINKMTNEEPHYEKDFDCGG